MTTARATPAAQQCCRCAAAERRYAPHRDKSWPAAFVLDPIHAVKADGEWFLPFSELDAKDAEAATKYILQLAGKENLPAVTDELTEMQLAPLPQAMQHALPTLTRRTPLPNGKVQLVDSGMRRGWCQTIACPHFPHLSRVAVRLLSFMSLHAPASPTGRFGATCALVPQQPCHLAGREASLHHGQ